MQGKMGLGCIRKKTGAGDPKSKLVLSDEDIWKRLELLSIFPKQVVLRDTSCNLLRKTGKGKKPVMLKRMSLSFRGAQSNAPPMPPLDTLIYNFDDAVAGVNYLMVMNEFKVDEVLHYIDE